MLMWPHKIFIIKTGIDDMFKIDSELKAANVARTIRFTEKMFDELNVLATKNNISFNYLVLQCCKYALDPLETDDSKK